jgi:hypothetical protein
MNMDSVFKKSENVVFRKIGDEYVLVPLFASVADVESIFNLNETGATVWEKIDGRKNIRDIVAEMQTEYEAENLLIEKDVIAFVNEMMTAKLLLEA